MAIDWDAELLGPVMDAFGEGSSIDPASWPTYTPRGGAAFQLQGAVFDRAYTEIVLDGDGSEITNRRPCLGVRAALFDARGIAPMQGDTVFIPSVALTYIVKDVQPDGHGHAKLILMTT